MLLDEKQDLQAGCAVEEPRLASRRSLNQSTAKRSMIEGPCW